MLSVIMLNDTRIRHLCCVVMLNAVMLNVIMSVVAT
jgi:hypothetical protein